VGGRRRTFDRVAGGFLQGSFDTASFFLQLGYKDMALATALARELEVPVRMADLAFEELAEAMNRGWGRRDSSSPMLLQEERSGVHIAVDDAKVKAVLNQEGSAT
jgi:3-hydroxyisobutyrate dehydrogenase